MFAGSSGEGDRGRGYTDGPAGQGSDGLPAGFGGPRRRGPAARCRRTEPSRPHPPDSTATVLRLVRRSPCVPPGGHHVTPRSCPKPRRPPCPRRTSPLVGLRSVGAAPRCCRGCPQSPACPATPGTPPSSPSRGEDFADTPRDAASQGRSAALRFALGQQPVGGGASVRSAHGRGRRRSPAPSSRSRSRTRPRSVAGDRRRRPDQRPQTASATPVSSTIPESP